MLKETGHFDEAEKHYRLADELRPQSADLAMQFGHLYKTSGRPREAETAYRTALKLNPGWSEAINELANMVKDGRQAPDDRPDSDFVREGTTTYPASLVRSNTIIRELAPLPPNRLGVAHHENFEIGRIGRTERTYWGTASVLRGVDAIRGYCISAIPMTGVQILLNGETIYRSAIEAGYPLQHESERKELRKYPFNAWIDFSSVQPGRYQLEIRVVNARGRSRKRQFNAVIEGPLLETSYPGTDSVITLDTDDPRSIDEQVNSRPSMVRSGRRALFPKAPRNILIQRVDQLGDMVASVPALRRLRDLFPEAKLIGLLSHANAGLARTLNLFDDIIVTDFAEDPVSRRRAMPIETQIQVGEALSRYDFDIAIDMSENSWSRRLLLLSRAAFLYGFRTDSDLPILGADVTGNTRDRPDGMEIVPHSNKLLGLIEWLGAMARSEPNIVRKDSISGDAARYLPRADRSYALLHDGARLVFSRWPGYLNLAQKIIQETDLDVVMITDHPNIGNEISECLRNSGRFNLIAERMPFDHFDELVSECAVFVGNDSGPKHLAALRGAKVVSIHMARNNWNEWGQESGGLILSRRVPCAGCVIHHDPEECGKGFPCIRLISVDEVFAAVQSLLSPAEELESIN
jgi:ADP-heptose:LPS heptosyltransferase